MKLKKFSSSCSAAQRSAAQRIAITLLIAVFIIAGIIACSGDTITGGRGGGYYSSSVENSGGETSDGGDGGSSGDGNIGGDGNTGDGGVSGGDGNAGDGGASGGDGSSGDGTTKPDDGTPSFPNDNPFDYYDLRVPYVVEKGFTNVSYKDTNKLRQLWIDQINRKYYNDGKVLAIRNRGNNRGPNEFQSGDQDYYYFNDNGDMVYKPDNTIIKKFMGAVIARYRDVRIDHGHKTHMGLNDNTSAIIKTTWTERKHDGQLLHTVGGIYANALTTAEATKKYLVGGAKQGVYDFVTYWHNVETYHNGAHYENYVFERQYTSPGFIEVFVIYDHWEGGHPYFGTGAAVHSYFPYYGSGSTTNGFTARNLPIMTNHNLYLGEKPDYVMSLLNCTALFTDIGNRNWNFLFFPGHKN